MAADSPGSGPIHKLGISIHQRRLTYYRRPVAAHTSIGTKRDKTSGVHRDLINISRQSTGASDKATVASAAAPVNNELGTTN
jgi:hypothetical protein